MATNEQWLAQEWRIREYLNTLDDLLATQDCDDECGYHLQYPHRINPEASDVEVYYVCDTCMYTASDKAEIMGHVEGVCRANV